ncbi:MAG: CotH kinase family protein [Oscillospiraceae bacterium]|nr:CotH kinase family protein [Oscillospiraceae bacterium]
MKKLICLALALALLLSIAACSRPEAPQEPQTLPEPQSTPTVPDPEPTPEPEPQPEPEPPAQDPAQSSSGGQPEPEPQPEPQQPQQPQQNNNNGRNNWGWNGGSSAGGQTYTPRDPAAVPGPETVSAETGIKLYDYYTPEILPKIYITTQNGIALDDRSLVIPDEHKGLRNELPVYDYAGATVTVTDCPGFEFEAAQAKVKIRGNYTSSYPKRPLRIKFSQKQAMCGLNGGAKLKNWVLLAEYKDASLLRNSAMFFMANSLYSTTGNYATDFRFVEVYINGQYNGVYVLAEQQEENKNRINVPKAADPEDYDLENLTAEESRELHNVKIGYFFEYDGYYKSEPELEQFAITYGTVRHLNGSAFTPRSGTQQGQAGGRGGFSMSRDIGFSIKSDVYFQEQNDFLKKCVQTIWNVIYEAVYTDHSDLAAHPFHTMDADGNYVTAPGITTVYEAVAAVVDVDSLIDMYILQEICEDTDLYWSSFFFALDMSEEGAHRLVYTAPWDFDSGMGFNSTDANSLYAMESDNPWLTIFCGQEWFWQRVWTRWQEAASAGVFTGVIEMIQKSAELYKTQFGENLAKWSNNRETTGRSGQSFSNHSDAANYLAWWLSNRIANLDKLLRAQVQG